MLAHRRHTTCSGSPGAKRLMALVAGRMPWRSWVDPNKSRRRPCSRPKAVVSRRAGRVPALDDLQARRTRKGVLRVAARCAGSPDRSVPVPSPLGECVTRGETGCAVHALAEWRGGDTGRRSCSVTTCRFYAANARRPRSRRRAARTRRAAPLDERERSLERSSPAQPILAGTRQGGRGARAWGCLCQSTATRSVVLVVVLCMPGISSANPTTR